jgi:transcriptional regulator with XRE-family HTH domain
VDSTESLYYRIGKRVRELREKRGLTQKALASLVGLTRTSITNIELGQQKLLVHTLFELASALNVEACELLTLDDVQIGNPKELEKLIRRRPRIEREWIKATMKIAAKGD